MPDPQGYATFPGVNRVIAATMNVVRGISPSVCTIVMDPQSAVQNQPGTLTFKYGNEVIEWFDCMPDYANLQLGADGYSWVVSFFDRRWRWKLSGGISGKYNVWRDDTSIIDDRRDPNAGNQQEPEYTSERTPRELAEQCLSCMGESKYDISALPNESRPPVVWDYENPAEALAQLCESLGCDITLRISDGKVAIVQTGEGADLPTDGVMVPSYNIDTQITPEIVTCVCGEKRYQVDFELEAVGLDIPQAPNLTNLEYAPTGHLLKPLNQLSYAIDKNDPNEVGGFKFGDFPYFQNVANDGIGYPNEVSGLRELAANSVLKYYRIKMPANGTGIEIPGYLTYHSKGKPVSGRVYYLPQILLDDSQIFTWWSTEQELEELPPYVYGQWYDGLKDLKNTCTKVTPAQFFAYKKPPDTRDVFYKRPFVVDPKRHLVIFEEAVFRNAETTTNPTKITVAPAKLRLRIACRVEDMSERATLRHEVERDVPGSQFPAKLTYSQKKAGLTQNARTRKLIFHDELVACYIPTYDDSFKVKSIRSNLDKPFAGVLSSVNQQANYYIDAELKQYDTIESLQMQYGGLRTDIEVDGAIQQVTFSVGSPEGAFTMASRGSEIRKYVLPFKERRRIERTKAREAAEKKERAEYDRDQKKLRNQQRGRR